MHHFNKIRSVNWRTDCLWMLRHQIQQNTTEHYKSTQNNLEWKGYVHAPNDTLKYLPLYTWVHQISSFKHWNLPNRKKSPTIFQSGCVYKIVVTKVQKSHNSPDQNIGLSAKQLLPNRWKKYQLTKELENDNHTN